MANNYGVIDVGRPYFAIILGSQDTAAYLTMWADGESPKDIPEQEVVRHYWMDNNTNYLIFAIHKNPNKPAWDSCTIDRRYYGAV